MAARHQQRDKRKPRRIIREKRRQQVTLEVMHAEHRLAERGGQRASDGTAHEQRTGEAGPARIGNHIDLIQSATGIGKHLSRQRQRAADVVARGQLRHHTAVVGVHRDLAVKRLRQQTRHGIGAVFDQRHAGFVA